MWCLTKTNTNANKVIAIDDIIVITAATSYTTTTYYCISNWPSSVIGRGYKSTFPWFSSIHRLCSLSVIKGEEIIDTRTEIVCFSSRWICSESKSLPCTQSGAQSQLWKKNPWVPRPPPQPPQPQIISTMPQPREAGCRARWGLIITEGKSIKSRHIWALVVQLLFYSNQTLFLKVYTYI